MRQSLQRVLAKEPIKGSLSSRQISLEKFFAWFIPIAKKRVVSVEECANFIARTRPDIDITMSNVRGYIKDTKLEVERTQGNTLWNVFGQGWRIATEGETAISLIRMAYRTVRYADRTSALYRITDKSLIPSAMKKVFGHQPKKRAELQEYNMKFQRLFKNERRALIG